jgi:hypothetical protein
MLYYKILDNIADERGFKKMGYWCIKPLFSRAHKKAAKNYPDIECAVAEYIAAQNILEKEGCTSIDEAADPTAKVMDKILTLCSDDEMQKRVLSRLGYCLGRYVYLLDAVVDLPEDTKKGGYNVLKSIDKDEVKERIKGQLYFCTNEAAKAFELLDIKKYETILGNIIYLGLEETFLKELNNERSV